MVKCHVQDHTGSKERDQDLHSGHLPPEFTCLSIFYITMSSSVSENDDTHQYLLSLSFANDYFRLERVHCLGSLPI